MPTINLLHLNLNEQTHHLAHTMSIIRLVIVALATTLLTNCTSPIKPGKNHMIGLQPIGQYDPAQLQFIQNELQQFYKVPVIILTETAMPATFKNMTKGERYSADSIIKWLAHTAPDSITKVVGLTHRLRTVIIHELGHNMGFPHCSTKNCIMSDANERIQTVDNSADNYCVKCKDKL